MGRARIRTALLGGSFPVGLAVSVGLFAFAGGSTCAPPSLTCGTPTTAYVVLFLAALAAFAGVALAVSARRDRGRLVLAAASWAFALGLLVGSAVVQYGWYPGSPSPETVPPQTG
jgi:hypothetical protein